MASLSEIENSSQSQNQDEEVLADKPRMHTRIFSFIFKYCLPIGLLSDRIEFEVIRIRSDKTIGSDLSWSGPLPPLLSVCMEYAMGASL